MSRPSGSNFEYFQDPAILSKKIRQVKRAVAEVCDVKMTVFRKRRRGTDKERWAIQLAMSQCLKRNLGNLQSLAFRFNRSSHRTVWDARKRVMDLVETSHLHREQFELCEKILEEVGPALTS